MALIFFEDTDMIWEKENLIKSFIAKLLSLVQSKFDWNAISEEIYAPN